MKMKNIQSFIAFIGFTLVLWSCSSSPAPLDPTIPTLSFPLNNEACLEGVSLNDSQSSLEFRWNSSQNAVRYRLSLTNLSDNQNQSFETSGTSLSVTLLKNTPYSWSITAKGEEGSNDASSDSWKFYLASSGIINYAPFPTELLAPRSGTTVTPLDGEIILSWAGSDVDGDLDYYELYLDETDASTFIKQIDAISTTTETSIEVQSETAYSWKIIAVDSNGNKSNSGIYTFRTD